MSLAAEMEKRLRAAFQVTDLALENESARHAGHAGDDGSGESHFRLYLRTPELAVLPPLQRHRAVYKALGDLMGRLHALALDVG